MSGILSQTSYLITTTYNRIHHSLLDGYQLIKSNSRPYTILQIGYWSTLLLARCLVHAYPKLQIEALASTDRDLKKYELGKYATAAYDTQTGSVIKAAGITFGVNLIIGTIGVITLPAMIIPFSGISMIFIRAWMWGLIFSPLGEKENAINIPHLITMLIEGQAFIIAGLGDWFLAKRFLSQFRRGSEVIVEDKKGGSVDSKDEGVDEKIELLEDKKKGSQKTWFNLIWPGIKNIRWSGYKQGLKENLILYAPITAILAVSAIWEAVEVIHMNDWWFI